MSHDLASDCVFPGANRASGGPVEVLRQPSPKRRIARNLAWARCSGAGGGAQSLQSECPEQCRIKSASHTGQVFRNRRWFIPLNCRKDDGAPLEKMPSYVEEGLLYLALYRDKVDEISKHREEAEKAKDRREAKQRRRHRHEEALPNTDARSVQDTLREYPSVWSPRRRVRGGASDDEDYGSPRAPADPSSSAADLVASSSSAALAAPSPRLGGDASAPRRSGAAEVRGPPAHLASVTTRVAHGVVTEHLEAKHLGRLFDQWYATKEADGVSSPTASSSSAAVGHLARSARGFATATPSLVGSPTAASLRDVSSSAAATPSVSGPRSPAARGGPLSSRGVAASPGTSGRLTSMLRRERLGAAAGAEAAEGSAAGADGQPAVKAAPRPPRRRFGSFAGTGGRRPPQDDSSGTDGADDEGERSSPCPPERLPELPLERSKASVVFGVLTNPRTRTDNFAARGRVDREAKIVTHIEGVPALNLMKLYEGPWRMNI